MTIFDKTETRFDHFGGKLVKYDNKVMAIAGRNAEVEEFNPRAKHLYLFMQLSWTEHSMSPVNGYRRLDSFTALSMEKSLFIFG